MQIKLANPRGFCAGVDRAIEIVNRALEVFGPPIYVRHEVVHNKFVVEDLRARGAIFVEELDQVPDDVIVIFSAHGVSQAVRSGAAGRGPEMTSYKYMAVVGATVMVTVAVGMLALNLTAGEKRITYQIQHQYAVADPQFQRAMGVLLGPALLGIADKWSGNAEDPDHWRDTHFRIEGPAVAQMQSAFMDN
jgi:hypothetical protein